MARCHAQEIRLLHLAQRIRDKSLGASPCLIHRKRLSCMTFLFSRQFSPEKRI
jgi:hypothetical protein